MTSKSSSRVGRIVAYVISALTLAIVAANLFGLISLRIVQTTSMQGTIEVGDLVVSQNWLKPAVGDIAVYKATDFQGVAQAMVVHRVIAGDEAGGLKGAEGVAGVLATEACADGELAEQSLEAAAGFVADHEVDVEPQRGGAEGRVLPRADKPLQQLGGGGAQGVKDSWKRRPHGYLASRHAPMVA